MYPIRINRPAWNIIFFTEHKCSEVCQTNVGVQDDGTFVLFEDTDICVYQGGISPGSISLFYDNNYSDILNIQESFELPENFTIVVDFPLTNPCKLKYTRTQLLTEVQKDTKDSITVKDIIDTFRKVYNMIYDAEYELSTETNHEIIHFCASCNDQNYNNLNQFENISSSERCSICYSENAQEPSIQLSCNHTFHRSCLETWFSRSNSCPICRRPIFFCNECQGRREYTTQEFVSVPPFVNGLVYARPLTDGPYGIYDFYLEELLFKGITFNRLTNEVRILSE